MAQTKTSLDRIASVLNRGPRRGLTRSEIAARAKVNANSVGVYLSQLIRSGRAQVVGQEPSTGGRPANRYSAA